MPERVATRYEATLHLSVEAPDRNEAVDWMVGVLRAYGGQVEAGDFGDEGEEDVVVRVPDVVLGGGDVDDDDEFGSLSLWAGDSEYGDRLQGVFKVLLTTPRHAAAEFGLGRAAAHAGENPSYTAMLERVKAGGVEVVLMDVRTLRQFTDHDWDALEAAGLSVAEFKPGIIGSTGTPAGA
jgi:hypothetical protein